MDGANMTISVKFAPDINLDNPCSRNYNGALWFEYDEHPNKVNASATFRVNES